MTENTATTAAKSGGNGLVAAPPRALFIVSNRLPFSLKRGEDGSLHAEASAGGLVTALLPLMTQSCARSLWIGWPGLMIEDADVDASLSSSSSQQAAAALAPCPVAIGVPGL